MRKLAFALISFIAVLNCLGQEKEGYEYSGHLSIRPFVETYTSRANGYQGWGFAGNGGADFLLKHTTLTAKVGVDTLDKKIINSGTTFRVEGNGYYSFSRHFFAGGGFAWGRLMTNQYTKQAIYPYVGAGGVAQGCTFSVNYYLPGSDNSNGVRGPRIESVVPIKRKRLDFVYMIGFMSVQPTDCPNCARQVMGDLRTGLRFKF